MKNMHAAIACLPLLILAAPSQAQAQTQAPSRSEQAVAQALAQGYAAFLAHDAKGAAKALDGIPKNHLLRPWAQGWAALSEPSADARSLAAFSKKFPPSLMKWRLLSMSAQQAAKEGDLPAAQAALSAIPPAAQGPLGRCIGALGRQASAEESIELLAQGAGSESCSKAALGIAANVDALGAAFSKMAPEHARQAAALLGATGSAAPAKALENLSLLNASPQWVDELPLSSKESLSKMVATELGRGKCPKALPEPEHLTDKGMGNAARCALWTSGPSAALPYWGALAISRPKEARWGALSWLAGAPGEAPSAPSTSYAALALREATGAGSPPIQSPLAAPKCSEASIEIDLALWRVGLRKEAIDSWREELSRADAPRKACMGLAAGAIDAHPMRIAAFASDEFDPRAYAAGFEEITRSSASSHGIPEELWISLARQESRFDAEAVSRSGAAGLFQLMPGTAKEAASEAKMAPPSEASLREPSINSAIASSHFAKLWSQFDHSPIWSLCAYNAGAGRCKGWKAKLGSLPPAFQIEAMPFDETRVYVERILSGWTLTEPANPARAAFLAHGIRMSPEKKPPPKPAKK